MRWDLTALKPPPCYSPSIVVPMMHGLLFPLLFDMTRFAPSVAECSAISAPRLERIRIDRGYSNRMWPKKKDCMTSLDFEKQEVPVAHYYHTSAINDWFRIDLTKDMI